MFKKLILLVGIIAIGILCFNQRNSFIEMDFKSLSQEEETEEVVDSETDSDEEIEKMPVYDIEAFDSKTGYYYELLETEEEQNLYKELVMSIADYEEEFDLSISYSAMDIDIVWEVYYFVLFDYPQYFWTEGGGTITYTDTEDGKILKALKIVNNYTADEIIYYKEQLDIVAEEIIASVSDASTEYELAVSIYEYIIENCDYDDESAEIVINDLEETAKSMQSGSIVGCLLYGEAICSGYAKAYTFLLNKLDINCFSAFGYAQGYGHEWNIIELNDEYYYVDCTWGDSQYENQDEEYISYNYFGLTTEQISKTHTAEEDIEYPLCIATECNYYVYNGLCFEYYDSETIIELFQDAIDDNIERVDFCYTTQEDYEEALAYILEDGMNVIIGLNRNELETRYSYGVTEELYIISVVLYYQ